MEAYWTEHTDSSNIQEVTKRFRVLPMYRVLQSFKWFTDAMILGCDNFLRHANVFSEMRNRNFDVAIVEPLSICGLGFAKALGIERTILASSCAHYDMIFQYIGEPDEHSYLPALVSLKGDKMGFAERYENYRVAEVGSQLDL